MSTPADACRRESSPDDREDRERWLLSPSAAAFIKERARALKTEPATVLEDLVLVERRRVEGAL